MQNDEQKALRNEIAKEKIARLMRAKEFVMKSIVPVSNDLLSESQLAKAWVYIRDGRALSQAAMEEEEEEKGVCKSASFNSRACILKTVFDSLSNGKVGIITRLQVYQGLLRRGSLGCGRYDADVFLDVAKILYKFRDINMDLKLLGLQAIPYEVASVMDFVVSELNLASCAWEIARACEKSYSGFEWVRRTSNSSTEEPKASIMYCRMRMNVANAEQQTQYLQNATCFEQVQAWLQGAAVTGDQKMSDSYLHDSLLNVGGVAMASHPDGRRLIRSSIKAETCPTHWRLGLVYNLHGPPAHGSESRKQMMEIVRGAEAVAPSSSCGPDVDKVFSEYMCNAMIW
jgi:hypothetical protein